MLLLGSGAQHLLLPKQVIKRFLTTGCSPVRGSRSTKDEATQSRPWSWRGGGGGGGVGSGSGGSSSSDGGLGALVQVNARESTSTMPLRGYEL